MAVAVSQLDLVRLLRDAIRTADIESAKQFGPAERSFVDRGPAATFERSQRLCDRRVYERCCPVRTDVCSDRRPVQAAPVSSSVPAQAASVTCVTEGCEPKAIWSDIPGRIQPPWKVLPWQEPAKVEQKVKVIIERPEVIHKGMLLDFFI